MSGKNKDIVNNGYQPESQTQKGYQPVDNSNPPQPQGGYQPTVASGEIPASNPPDDE